MSTEGLVRAEPGRVAGPAASSRKRARRKRFAVAALVLLAALGYLVYSAIASNSEYYLTVSEVYALSTQDTRVKVGGKVVEGSVVWDRGSNAVGFEVTDGQRSMPVAYKGVVPDSFQPGAEVILEGRLRADGRFVATSLLAKCASKYEPRLSGK